MSMEPTIVLAMVAASTRHIGLIATASTTYNEPYNIARRYAGSHQRRPLGLECRHHRGCSVESQFRPAGRP
jgi:Luciferase-like monooxygenase